MDKDSILGQIQESARKAEGIIMATDDICRVSEALADLDDVIEELYNEVYWEIRGVK